MRHVAVMGEMRNTHNILVSKTLGDVPLWGTGDDETVILKSIVKKQK
jgi:hypothetical protein